MGAGPDPEGSPIVLVRPDVADPAPWDGVRRDILAEILGFPADTELVTRDGGVDCEAAFVIEEGPT